MEETWRDIAGYEGMYQVSNLGRVRSLDRTDKRGRKWSGKVLAPIKTKLGYLHIHLLSDGKPETAKIHRLVAESFIPNPDNLPEINHKDENKANNVVTNLEWCDRRYNTTYGKFTHEYISNRVSGENNGRSKIKKKEAEEIRRLYVRGSRDFNITKLAEAYGLCPSQIGNIVRGESWK